MRLAVVGLGQIAELALPPYAERDDVRVVGLCDVDPTRLERWRTAFPSAHLTTDLDDLLGLEVDVVDVLVPTPLHGEVATRVLEAGHHVQMQKPLTRSVDEADALLATATRAGAVLRVMEDYVHFPPLVELHDVVRRGEIGTPRALHMKVVATARGGWEVNPGSYAWQFEQAGAGLGILTFDHGWHQFALAHWLFGPIRRIFGWVRREGDLLDVPATFVWEHHDGVRAVLEMVLAEDMYFRSDYYADDERVEVVGTKGYARCNRISGRGVQEPSVVVYRDGQIRAWHALPDEPPDAFRASATHGIEWFRTGAGELLLDGATARAVLISLLAGLESSDRGVPVDIP
ncbi:MAG: Oxidoreductase domain protein [Acidimicrobiales bacterium]|nr:Oxidoreductase domain protein [Acidimicrobiales bacterium]